MNTKLRYLLLLIPVLLAGAALGVVSQSVLGEASMLQGGAPTVIAYQGEVRISGVLYTGTGYFKFAVVNAAGDTTYWSNDGTSSAGGEPTAAVGLTVSQGLFSVLLGDTALGGMTQALTADVFSEPDRYLRVWFSEISSGTFDQLTPDTRMTAVPYALQAQEAVDADTVDGLHANELGAPYQNVVVVAQSGGEYTSVQDAIDSVTDAAADNPYLVWVAPGVYSETVTMKPYVHLQGAGQDTTVITSTSNSSAWPPTPPTLLLASNTSLRDLTVGNSGAGFRNVALMATAGMSRTLVADVTAQAQGSGERNYGVFLIGSGTSVRLEQVSALAENASAYNHGLVNYDGAAATLYSGVFTARGGTEARGIGVADNNTTLQAVGVTALAENASGNNIGLLNETGAAATLRGGSYTAREGTNAYGIFNIFTALLEADTVTALGENGSNLNNGLYNYSASTAVLYGGDYTGRGGTQTGGVANQLNANLTAYGVTALAEDGSGAIGNYGMGNYDSSTAMLEGGVFIARGGINNYALSNEFNVTMTADHVTALAENGSDSNHGLWNVNNAKLVLHGATLTGRGGTNAYGIYTANDGTLLKAESVTALGEDGTNGNYGLNNTAQFSSDIMTTTLRSSSFSGDSGTIAYGIHISGTLATLEAESITAWAENGSSNNYGLYQDSGTVSLGVSRLNNGATRNSGTLICFQVYDGGYAAYTCP